MTDTTNDKGRFQNRKGIKNRTLEEKAAERKALRAAGRTRDKGPNQVKPAAYEKREFLNPSRGKPCPASGRKSTYDPKYCDVIINVAREGGNDSQMALACGLSDRKSLWRWRQKHPEFQEAYNYAKLVLDERGWALLKAYAAGAVPKGNFKAVEMMLKSANPEVYGNLNAESNPNIGNATQININGNIQTIENMDMDSLNKRIKEAMARIGPIVEVSDGTEKTKEETGEVL